MGQLVMEASGLGFRVQGSGFGFRVQGLGFSVWIIIVLLVAK